MAQYVKGGFDYMASLLLLLHGSWHRMSETKYRHVLDFVLLPFYNQNQHNTLSRDDNRCIFLANGFWQSGKLWIPKPAVDRTTQRNREAAGLSISGNEVWHEYKKKENEQRKQSGDITRIH
jgi:hypothetical protein